MIRTSSNIFLVLLCLSLATGCDKLSNHTGGSPIRIQLVANEATRTAAITTSGLEHDGHFVMDAYIDDDSFLHTYDSDHNIVDSEPVSKGAYIVSGGAYNVLYSSSNGWEIAPKEVGKPYCWVSDDETRFWCYWPQNSEVDASAEGVRSITAPTLGSTTMSFTYALPTHVDGTDADNQKDLIFAYTQKRYINEDRSTNTIDLLFHHALSQIRFCVSPDDGTFDVSLKIKKIEVVGVPNGGNAVFYGKSLTSGAETVWFTWTPSSTKGTYSQSYNTFFDTAPEDWTGSEISGGKHIYTCDNAFMLIPHTLDSSNAKLKITFYDPGTGKDEVREAKLVDTSDDQTKVWKPGFYYTYKIHATLIGRDISSYAILTDWSDRDSKIFI